METPYQDTTCWGTDDIRKPKRRLCPDELHGLLPHWVSPPSPDVNRLMKANTILSSGFPHRPGSSAIGAARSRPPHWEVIGNRNITRRAPIQRLARAEGKVNLKRAQLPFPSHPTWDFLSLVTYPTWDFPFPAWSTGRLSSLTATFASH